MDTFGCINTIQEVQNNDNSTLHYVRFKAYTVRNAYIIELHSDQDKLFPSEEHLDPQKYRHDIRSIIPVH